MDGISIETITNSGYMNPEHPEHLERPENPEHPANRAYKRTGMPCWRRCVFSARTLVSA
jgi:hypothetical protein